METFDVVTTVKLPKQRIQDLLVGLFENGCSSWLLEIGDYVLPGGLIRNDFRRGGKMQGAEYYHPSQIVPVTEGCTLFLFVENPNAEGRMKFDLNVASIQKGLEVMASKFPTHFGNILSENDDAGTADIFGQCVVYGDMVYC
jgi:hypothetical protein